MHHIQRLPLIPHVHSLLVQQMDEVLVYTHSQWWKHMRSSSAKMHRLDS